MKKCAAIVLSVLILGVLCWTAFAEMELCSACRGSGELVCDICRGLGSCVTCNGRGTVGYVPDYTGRGRGHDVTCTACNGSRRCWRCNGNPRSRCHACGGSGYVDW